MESSITSKLATNSSKLFEQYPFLGVNYWFGTPNEASFAGLVPLEIVSTLVFIAALVFLAYKLTNSKLTPPDHKFLTRTIWLTLFFGPVGWLLIIFRNIGVVLLSARFFWLIWFGLLFWVAYYLFRYQRRVLPKSKETYASYQLKKRYFPKKKRR